MSEVTRVGVDLAKKVFEVCGVNAQGEVVLRRRLTRGRFLKFFAKLPPCLVGMEACGGAHHWARQLQKLGHEVRLMAPQYVRPYRKRDKNDRTDAEAICEAVDRPNMHFVPIKDEAQQAIPGVGPLTASAAVAMIGDGHQFRNGRQVANWLGLVPRHRGSGGRNRLGRIHKRGDAYLRTLLVNGARSALSRWQKQPPESRIARRILALADRAGFNKAVVALAARNARVIWAMLHHHSEYRPA